MLERIPGQDEWIERPYRRAAEESAEYEKWIEENEERLMEEFMEEAEQAGPVDDAGILDYINSHGQDFEEFCQEVYKEERGGV